jgi:uncharacterized membrane protein YdjX (TVP38/TMEM64 family)
MMNDHRKRAVVVSLLLALLVAVAAFHPLHAVLAGWSARAGSVIEQHAIAGPVIFLLLSMLSAMLAFFSTAVLIPITVTAWGKTATLVLLWSGWFLGGALSVAIGRFLGRPAVRHFIAAERLDQYEREVKELVGFPQLLLLQLALPSEIPGYVTGMLRFRPGRYLLALAIAELPFAAGAVFLGESFLKGNLLTVLLVGAAGIALSWSAGTMLYRRRQRRIADNG